jgi:ABC-2 type transport system ATP-binding protein
MRTRSLSWRSADPGDFGAMSIELTAVRKRFSVRGPWVLNGIDLALPAGTMTAIVGTNGSGKSTLLRIVAGASTATSGEVRRRTRSVGYVPERLPAALRMTATEYLGHMGRIRGCSERAISRRSTELLDRFALQPGPDVPISTLSKGNSQKVAITQALLGDPKLLVLDEPFSGLDGKARPELIALLDDARAKGAAILVTGHDAAELPDADVTHRLAAGRLTADTMPEYGLVLVLRAIDPTVDLTALAGVSVRESSSERLVLWASDPDGVLRIALNSGWSLVEAHL